MSPAERSKERTFYAARRRVALILELAPDLRCARCGRVVEDPRELQIDHADGKAWHARRLSSHTRVARYWREHNAGIALRVLCALCNATDGAYKRLGVLPPLPPPEPEDDEVPF